MSELITVKQLPVLKEQFKAKGEEIDEEVSRCESMVVTGDNYKDIKKIRAGLNKESKEFATQFKEIKDKVLAPWNAVETAQDIAERINEIVDAVNELKGERK